MARACRHVASKCKASNRPPPSLQRNLVLPLAWQVLDALITKVSQVVACETPASSSWECALCTTEHAASSYAMFCSTCGVPRPPRSLIEAFVQEALAHLLCSLGQAETPRWANESEVYSVAGLEWGLWLATFLVNHLRSHLLPGQLHNSILFEQLRSHVELGPTAPCAYRVLRLLITLTEQAARFDACSR